MAYTFMSPDAIQAAVLSEAEQFILYCNQLYSNFLHDVFTHTGPNSPTMWMIGKDTILAALWPVCHMLCTLINIFDRQNQEQSTIITSVSIQYINRSSLLHALFYITTKKLYLIIFLLISSEYVRCNSRNVHLLIF